MSEPKTPIPSPSNPAAYARLWPNGRRALLLLAALALAGGLALNWSWLVAVGVAPVLIAVLPCLVMCGLGLCMNKMTGGACERQPSAGGSDEVSAGRSVQSRTVSRAGSVPAIGRGIASRGRKPPAKERRKRKTMTAS